MEIEQRNKNADNRITRTEPTTPLISMRNPVGLLLTTVMPHGSQQDNMKLVVDLLDKLEDKKNFILAPGCDMPYDVPVENTIGIVQAIRETESVREMLKNYVAQDDDIEIELPDYAHLEKSLVEVFTLDSATCLLCI